MSQRKAYKIEVNQEIKPNSRLKMALVSNFNKLDQAVALDLHAAEDLIKTAHQVAHKTAQRHKTKETAPLPLWEKDNDQGRSYIVPGVIWIDVIETINN